MTQTVTAEDGTVHNFPDEATPEMMMQALNVPPPAQGFIGRVSTDWAKRDANLNQLSDLVGQNKSVGGNAGLVYNGIGQTLQKGLSDIPSEAIKSATSYIPDWAKNLGHDAYSAAKDNSVLLDTLDRGAGWTLDQASQGYNKFKQNNPTPALYLDSTLGFGNALAAPLQIAGESLPSQAVGAAQDVLKGTGKAVADAASQAKDLILPPVPAAEGAFKEAGKAYDVLDNSQTVLTPQGVQKFVAAAKQAANVDPQVHMVFPNSETGQIVQGLQNLADSGQPVKIQTLHSLVKKMSQAANGHFSQSLDETGREILNMKDSILHAAQNPDPGDLTGGTAGFDAWQKANDFYTKGSQLEDIEKVIQRAQLTKNPQTSLQSGFRNLLLNAKKTRGYSEEGMAALEKASQTGTVGDVLHTFGSRIIPAIAAPAGAAIGMGIGGPIGSLAGGAISGAVSYGASSAARAGATALQMSRANNLRKIIGSP